MSKHFKIKSKIIGLGLALVAPFSIVGGLSLATKPALADESSYITEWTDETVGTTLVNSNSFNITSSYSEGNSLSGWTAIDYDAFSKGMIIDIGTNFNNNQNIYNLTNNPGKYSGKDNKILMINSKYDRDVSPAPAKRGYRSNEFTLKANSYYKLSVDAATSLDGYADVNEAYGSIYVTGLTDANDKEIKLAYEGITGGWATYNFFIATGNEEQTVTLDLYLGKSNTEKSFGVAFFDEVTIEQFSQNAFIADCLKTEQYNFEDNYTNNLKKRNKFLLEALTFADNTIRDKLMAENDYDFDFEKSAGTNGLTEEWKIVKNASNAHAVVMDVTKAGQVPFEDLGYSFIGNDLSYDISKKLDGENTRALVMYTNKNTEANFVLENSKPIEIKAHTVYKISMKVKTSEITGAFYVNIRENDKIIDTYFTDNNGNKIEDAVTLQSASSTGFSSNASNKATNDYTEISFYVKGRAFYDSSINLQLALGNETTPANGLVVVDNIRIDYASSADAESADNFLNLETASVASDNNLYFDDVEIEGKELAYPLTAKNWTLTQPEKESDKVGLAGGVIYLYNEAAYNATYKGNYDWATSYPGHPYAYDKNSTMKNPGEANNVYMMHNANYGWQSLTSNTFKLEANSYYNLKFSYKTLNRQIEKDAQILVEVIDENNITLYKEKLASTNDIWDNNVDIYFRTALTSSHNVKVKISFGTEDDKMTGTVYLDNFSFDKASITEDVFNSKTQKADLTDYMLNLDVDGSIGYELTSSPAYELSVDGKAGSLVGGIVKGDENEFGVEYTKGNLLVLSARTSPTSGTLKSKYTFSLNSSTQYYKLTFDLKTKLAQKPGTVFTEEEIKDKHKCNYGVKIGLTDFEIIEKLISNDEFKTYTIYFKATADQVSNLSFGLVVDQHTEGSAYLSNIMFEESTEEFFTQANDKNSAGYQDTVWTSELIEKPDDSDTTPDDENSGSTVNQMNWILIPSIITSVAVIVAVIGWLLRHIKIKKIEKVREESYDRKISLNREAITLQATAERDREVEEIKANIKELEDQRKLLEDDHKTVIKDARLNSKGKITKDTEREFKSYASKLSRINEKIEILNGQLNKVNSNEYLISVERRIVSEETKRQKDLIKQQDKENKDKIQK